MRVLRSPLALSNVPEVEEAAPRAARNIAWDAVSDALTEDSWERCDNDLEQCMHRHSRDGPPRSGSGTDPTAERVRVCACMRPNFCELCASSLHRLEQVSTAQKNRR